MKSSEDCWDSFASSRAKSHKTTEEITWILQLKAGLNWVQIWIKMDLKPSKEPLTGLICTVKSNPDPLLCQYGFGSGFEMGWMLGPLTWLKGKRPSKSSLLKKLESNSNRVSLLFRRGKETVLIRDPLAGSEQRQHSEQARKTRLTRECRVAKVNFEGLVNH